MSGGGRKIVNFSCKQRGVLERTFLGKDDWRRWRGLGGHLWRPRRDDDFEDLFVFDGGWQEDGRFRSLTRQWYFPTRLISQ